MYSVFSKDVSLLPGWLLNILLGLKLQDLSTHGGQGHGGQGEGGAEDDGSETVRNQAKSTDRGRNVKLQLDFDLLFFHCDINFPVVFVKYQHDHIIIDFIT